jgi:pimeloyl-ACP methyl ester carboxylesterase
MDDAATEFRHQQIRAAGCSVHVVEAGPSDGRPFLFLHGWPESWSIWRQVMALASGQARAIAIDLPGVGRSRGGHLDGTKAQLAGIVHDLITAMGLSGVTLIGHDVGGMIAYSCLRRFGDLARVVIMDTLVPGIQPWDEAIRAPGLWHFALHSVPGLPEALVDGRQRRYFDYFYDILSPDPKLVDDASRTEYAEAYRDIEALTAGFDWYRAFEQDARDNATGPDARDNAAGREPVMAPLLYLRGDHEAGDIEAYVEGFRSAGVRDLQSGVILKAGHFAPTDAPAAVWEQIERFAMPPVS